MDTFEDAPVQIPNGDGLNVRMRVKECVRCPKNVFFVPFFFGGADEFL